MKRVLATAILALGTIGTAFAQGPQPATGNGVVYGGYLEVWGAGLFAHGNNAGDNSPTIDDEMSPEFGGAGRITVPLNTHMGANQLSFQFDLDGSANFPGGDANVTGVDETMGSTFIGTVHLSLRKSQSHLFGLFGSFGTASASEDESGQVFVAGVEGQIHASPNLTFYGQGGFFTAEHPEDSSVDEGIDNAWFVRAVGRYFFDEESFIEAEGTYARGDLDPGDNGSGNDQDSMVAWGVKYERRLPTDAPIYYFAGYRGSMAENRGDGGRYNEHRAIFGLKFAFNGGLTARQNNQRGTTLDTPWAIGRWSGYAMESLD